MLPLLAIGKGLLAAAPVVASLFGGAKKQKAADKLNKQQLQYAQQRWAAGAPLREQGMSAMLNQRRPDLSAQYGGTQNPFARRPMAPPPPVEAPVEAPAPVGIQPVNLPPRRGGGSIMRRIGRGLV